MTSRVETGVVTAGEVVSCVVVGGVTTALVVAGVEAGVGAASDGEVAGELAIGRGKESVSVWLNVLQAPVYDSRSPGATTEKSSMRLPSYRRTRPNARHQHVVHSTALFHPPLRITIAHHANKDVPPDPIDSTIDRTTTTMTAPGGNNNQTPSESDRCPLSLSANPCASFPTNLLNSTTQTSFNHHTRIL